MPRVMLLSSSGSELFPAFIQLVLLGIVQYRGSNDTETEHTEGSGREKTFYTPSPLFFCFVWIYGIKIIMSTIG